MVRTDSMRYFFSRGSHQVPDGRYLYDLDADPQELDNLAGQGRPEEAVLDLELRRWLAAERGRDASEAEWSSDDLERLRGLGYLE